MIKPTQPKQNDEFVIPKGLPQVNYHWFTPSEVLEDLEQVKKDGRRKPRSLSRRKIDTFSRAMLERRWRPDTLEPIKYDSNGLLMDGFHRFHALLKAGIPVLMGMGTDLDPAVEPILDSGTSKSRMHTLQQHGYKYAASMSSACATLWCLERKIWRVGDTYIDNETVRDIADKYDELESYIGDISSKAHFIRSGIVVAALFWIEKSSPDRGKTFVDAVLSGADGERSLLVTDPRFLLREALLRNFAHREYLATFRGRNTTVAVIFRCFKQFLAGKALNRIKFTMDPTNYYWPEGAPYVVE